MATDSLYTSQRLIDGYAFSRPAVHGHLIAAIAQHLGLATPVGVALDIGSGAGLSAAALDPVARTVVGLEPVTAMLAHRTRVAPRAHFVAGIGEALPVAAGAVDLITAAGAINYTDRDRFLPEVRRVLKPDGVFALYDFSPGRRFRGDDELDRWFSEFEHRYPAEPGYALDVTTLPYERYGLRLERFQVVEPVVPMTAAAYLEYVLTETGVEIATGAGTPEREIREWCRQTLAPVFGDGTREVLFDAYVAYVRPEGTRTSG